MVACRIFAVLSALVAGQDIKFDVDKLTDFSTDMALTAEGQKFSKMGMRFTLKDLDVSGHIQLDLANEKFSSKMTGSYALAGPRGGPTVDEASGHSEITLVNGVIILKESGTAHNVLGTQEAAYCIKASVPPGRIPPGQNLKGMVASKLPMVEHYLNQEDPRGDYTRTVEDGVVTFAAHHEYATGYPVADSELKIKLDGVPILAEHSVDCTEDCAVPHFNGNSGSLKFSDWTTGAGDVEESQCVDSSAANLDKNFGVLSLTFLQALAEQFNQNGATKDIAMYFSDVAMSLDEEMRAHASVTPATTWQSLMAPFVAGMSGAAVVLALAKIYSGKRTRSEPLLSQA